LHLGVALDPEHHPRIATDGKSLILWLKDIHSEPYLLSLLDNFTSQVSTRAKEHGEQINSSFVESIAYLKKTLRTIDYGREKLINIRLIFPKSIVCHNKAFQDAGSHHIILHGGAVSPEYVSAGYPPNLTTNAALNTPIGYHPYLRFGTGFVLPLRRSHMKNQFYSTVQAQNYEKSLVGHMTREMNHLSFGTSSVLDLYVAFQSTLMLVLFFKITIQNNESHQPLATLSQALV